MCLWQPRSTSQPSTSDAEAYREWSSCWTNVNTILQQWDTTPDYFNGRYGSKEWFGDRIAKRSDLGAGFFSDEIMRWVQSDDYGAWEAAQLVPPDYVSNDWSDYVAITYGWGFAAGAGISEVSVVIDQNWHVYLRGGMGANTRGFSVSNGHILINTDPNGELFGSRIPLDRLNVSETERIQLIQDALRGSSASASGTGTLYLGFGGSVGLEPPYHMTVEEVAGAPGASVSPYSYTVQLR